ncbi:protein of unknown function [Paraburkholderia kururiensis]|jgi:hypothetical protein
MKQVRRRSARARYPQARSLTGTPLRAGALVKLGIRENPLMHGKPGMPIGPYHTGRHPRVKLATRQNPVENETASMGFWA